MGPCRLAAPHHLSVTWGEIGPADLAHGLAQIGEATSSFNHVGEIGPPDLGTPPAQIGGTTSALFVDWISRTLDKGTRELLLKL